MYRPEVKLLFTKLPKQEYILTMWIKIATLIPENMYFHFLMKHVQSV